MTHEIKTNCGRDVHYYGDTQLIDLTRGKTLVSSVAPSTSKAFVTIAGDGDILYEAPYAGSWGNSVSVTHVIGDVGVGNESRELSLTANISTSNLTIIFGTDGSGDSITPTTAQIEALVNNDENASLLTIATASATGAGSAGVQALTLLSGGANDGDYMVIGGKYPMAINEIKVV